MTARTITISQARTMARESNSLPAARLNPAIDEDDHLTAWEWVDRPDDVETYGSSVQVSVVGENGERRWWTVQAPE